MDRNVDGYSVRRFGQVISTAAEIDGDHSHAQSFDGIVQSVPLRIERPHEILSMFPEFFKRPKIAAIRMNVGGITISIDFNKVVHGKPPIQ